MPPSLAAAAISADSRGRSGRCRFSYQQAPVTRPYLGVGWRRVVRDCVGGSVRLGVDDAEGRSDATASKKPGADRTDRAESRQQTEPAEKDAERVQTVAVVPMGRRWADVWALRGRMRHVPIGLAPDWAPTGSCRAHRVFVGVCAPQCAECSSTRGMPGWFSCSWRPPRCSHCHVTSLQRRLHRWPRCPSRASQALRTLARAPVSSLGLRVVARAFVSSPGHQST